MNALSRSFVSLSIFVTFAASPVLAEQLTIPNTFMKGTTAVADEVNENFSAVETAVDYNKDRITTNQGDIADLKDQKMPAVKQVIDDAWIIMPITGNISSITVTPPAEGYVMVTATGTVTYPYASGGNGVITCLDLSDIISDCSGCVGMVGSKTAISSFLSDAFLSALTPGNFFGMPYSIVEVYEVTAGDTVTFYLNGYAIHSYSLEDGYICLLQSSLTALFIPNALP